MKATEFDGDLRRFLREYHFQPDLTRRLDTLNDTPLTQNIINEIVLWKTNRYFSLNNEILQSIEDLRNLRIGQHKQGKEVLEYLLNIRGVDLPMASTILRFRNSNTFQIIDRHAYRAVYDKPYPLYTASPSSRKIAVYFDYIDELIEFCKSRGLFFETIDRLLYIYDKCENGKLNKGGNTQKA